MMRLLYASERPPFPFFLGGAARCAHRLLDNLTRDHGVSCTAVGASSYCGNWTFPTNADHEALGVLSADPVAKTVDCGYPIRILHDTAGALDDFIGDFRPNIVWSQLEGARPILERAAAKGCRGLLYVHDAEFHPRELAAVAELGHHIVCSSEYLAEKIRVVTGYKASSIYPATDLYFGVSGDSDGTITMINPVAVKGVATFLEIAHRLPAERFLLVESWPLGENGLRSLESRLAGLPNVRFMHRVSDIQNVYRQTRLLLVPSRWEEGFGMVALEAQSCGIPVIASARGGLTESVGDGGLLIHDYLNAEAWVCAIRDVLETPGRYAELAKRARRHAASETFSTPALARRFLEICKSPPPARSPLRPVLARARRALARIPRRDSFLDDSTR